EIDQALAGLEGWRQDDDTLVREVEAESFLAGIELVRRVADAAEEADHHPDIDIRWRTVTFRLSTHSEGGLTAKDVDLAATIDGLAA
ncbi:MAG: 4a-hydroxytetrahydrobiopterin dehydratase, partial [Nocardioides sp.]